MEFVSDLVRKLKPHMAEMINGLVTGAVKFVLLRVDGDVLVEGVARKIKGDFSNADLTKRLAFQTSVENGNTFVFVLPSGSAAQSNVTVTNGFDPSNAGRMQIAMSSTEGVLRTFFSGTGAQVPLRLQLALVTKIELDTGGDINLTPSKRIKIGNASAAPGDTPSGGGYLFVESGALKFKGSSGTVTTIAAA